MIEENELEWPDIRPNAAGTNTEFVAYLMERRGNAAMNQLVIINAIDHYCRRVAETDKAPSDWPNLINWSAWQAACEDIHQALCERSKPKPQPED